MSSDAAALHPIERAILKALAQGEHDSIEGLAEAAGLSDDQTRRGIEWLKFKGLIELSKSSVFVVSLDAEGRGALQFGLPERRLVRAINEGKDTMAKVVASGALRGEEVNAAVSGARRNQWIQFREEGTIKTNQVSQSPEELVLARLGNGSIDESQLTDHEKEGLAFLKRRPGYIITGEQKKTRISITDAGRSLLPAIEAEKAQERRLTPDMITSGRWKDIEMSKLDIEAPAPAVFAGRRHPLVDMIEEVKEIFVGLGFSEIEGSMVQSGFWNFDALFTPQDHPAREMQDTFYISDQKKTVVASKEQIAKVSAIHKKEWGGWNSKEAQRLVLRTHTTPVTLQRLSRDKPEHARFFSVGRVFRNEKVSYKHLVEFHQVEGVATAPRASLRDLMGLQKEFYARMGIKKVKFWPTFFPYTEPSLQSMVYNDKLEKWVELFGMGIFRPEVTKPLGIKNPVLAWGGGLERIAMLRFELDDVRDLYGNKLSWLRSVSRCQL